MSSSCAGSISPLVLPHANVSVHAASLVNVRGVQLQLGTPPQAVSLRPSFANNDSYIPNSGTCDNDLTNLKCAGDYGGIYITSDSSTYTNISAAGESRSKITDKVTVNDDKSFDGMQMLLEGVGEESGLLGLDSNSSFINGLFDAGLVPSKSWGFDFGHWDVDNPRSGSLIVGGFDSNKVANDSGEFKTFSNCHTCAYVKEMEYKDENGSGLLLDNAVDPFWVQISPYRSNLNVPQAIFDKFNTLSNASYVNSTGGYGWLHGTRPGTLTITFSTGFRTTIQSNDMWQYPSAHNEKGEDVVTDPYTAQSMITASNASTPTWGIPILAANYLVYDAESQAFSLSELTPERRASSQSVQTFCGEAVSNSTGSDSAPPTATGSDGSSPSASGGSSSGNSAAPGQPSSSGSSNTGAIVGGVVGGIGGLLLIAAIAFFLWRRHKKSKGNPVPSGEPGPVGKRDEKYGYHPASSGYGSPMTELDGNNNRYVEMPADHHPVELPANEGRSELSSEPLRR